MNNLEIKKGNVLDTNFQVIAHQVNCQGVMGAGVAKAIKNKYYEVYSDYNTFCNDYNCSGEILLGQCLIVKSLDGKYIANLFGQDSFGANARQTNYKALYNAMKQLRTDMEEEGLKTLSFPYLIGCGLAGGNEETVISLIKEVFDDSDIIYNFYDIN